MFISFIIFQVSCFFQVQFFCSPLSACLSRCKILSSKEYFVNKVEFSYICSRIISTTYQQNNYVENDYLIESKACLTNDLKESVRWGRQEFRKMQVCTHDENDLNTIFEKVIVGNKENIEKKKIVLILSSVS